MPDRRIRSYVRREGRITAAQQRALRELWPRFGVDTGDAPLDFHKLFARRAPVVVEIGFGSGDALLEMATRHPESDYLGVEVWRPGVGSLMLRLAAAGVGNVRLILADAVEVLERNIAEASLTAVLLFFPDPWPKKRHHKRRLVQPAFAELVASRLQSGGHVHVATDWADYADAMLQVLSAQAGLANVAGLGGFAARPDYRPLTRYEARGEAHGHQVWDLVFEKLSGRGE